MPLHRRRRPLAILVVFVLLAALGTAIAGWTGLHVLLGLVPAWLIGWGLAHVVDAWQGHGPLRLSVAVGFNTLGVLATLAFLAWLQAVNAPARVRIEQSRTIRAPQEAVWKRVGQPARWPHWNAMLAELKPVGDPGAPGPSDRYDSELLFSDREIPTHHEIVRRDPPRALAWRIEVPEGSLLEELREEVRLEPMDGIRTRAVHRLRYRTPTLWGRVLSQLVVRPALTRMGGRSLDELARMEQDTGDGG